MNEKVQNQADALAAVARGFYSRGWALGTSGNFSAVVQRDPLEVVISSSGVDKGALSSNQFLTIDENASAIEPVNGKPSDESLLHIEVLKRTTAGAVFHTHSVWSTILSNSFAEKGGIRITGFEMLKGLKGNTTHDVEEWIPILENSQSMPDLARSVGELFVKHPSIHAFLLKRHGLYTWGKDINEAKRHVEICEFLFEAIGRESGSAYTMNK